ncbi:MAG: transcriptional regulator PpsR [Pseudomonadota bacterium]
MSSSTSLSDIANVELDASPVGAILAHACDIALILDADRVVRDAIISADDLPEGLRLGWVGQRLDDILTIESVSKAIELIAAARDNRPSRPRQVNHPIEGGEDLPVSYRAAAIGSEGEVVLMGRDLRTISQLQSRLVSTQQSMERDYERTRQMEARYRILFQNAQDAFVIVDAGDGRVLEANPKAAALFGREPEEFSSRRFSQFFDKTHRTPIEQMLAGVLASARTESLAATPAGGNAPFDVEASLFRAADATLFLVRLTARSEPGAELGPDAEANLQRLINRATDGIVLTDMEGAVLWANDAFLDMTQLAIAEHIEGIALGSFVGRTEIDMSVILGNARRHGRIRSFLTKIRGAGGLSTDVELSAVSMPNGAPPGYGFVIRNISLRTPEKGNGADELPQSAEQLTQLIGRMPLKEVVRQTTDVIERMCIQTALQLTGDNRASAAEMLGLSRQSLYVKLRRYDLQGPDESG